jgi:hypothetical protein
MEVNVRLEEDYVLLCETYSDTKIGRQRARFSSGFGRELRKVRMECG